MDTPTFDLCLVGPAHLGTDVKSVMEALASQRYRVVDCSSTDEYEDATNSRVRLVLEVLTSLKDGVVLLPGWRHDVVARVAAINAAALGIRVYQMDETMTTLADEAFDTDSVDGVIDAVTAHIERAHPDSAPDENLEERPHEEAARIVLGPRGAYYDHPYDNFTRTGYIWTGVLYSKLRDGEVVSPEDVALCMNGVKIAREAYRHKRDNVVDGHGYWLAHEMVVEERAQRERRDT